MKITKLIVQTSCILFILFFTIAVNDSFAFRVGEETAQINCNGENAETPCIITDPNGNRLGYDPVTGQSYKEIDGDFGLTELGCNECEDSEPSSHEALFNLTDGTYVVEIRGEDFSKFYISIYISKPDKQKGFDVYGVIDKGLSSTFKMTYSSDGSTPWAMTRVATSASLRQDIELSGKVGWIDNAGIVKSLLKKAEAIEKSISKDNQNSARGQLKAFISEINAQAAKHIDKKAVTILIEDAEYMIDNL